MKKIKQILRSINKTVIKNKELITTTTIILSMFSGLIKNNLCSVLFCGLLLISCEISWLNEDKIVIKYYKE